MSSASISSGGHSADCSAISSWYQRSRPGRTGGRRPCAARDHVLDGGQSTSASSPPPSAPRRSRAGTAVLRDEDLASASWIRSLSESAEKPPNTTSAEHRSGAREHRDGSSGSCRDRSRRGRPCSPRALQRVREAPDLIEHLRVRQGALLAGSPSSSRRPCHRPARRDGRAVVGALILPREPLHPRRGPLEHGVPLLEPRQLLGLLGPEASKSRSACS